MAKKESVKKSKKDKNVRKESGFDAASFYGEMLDDISARHGGDGDLSSDIPPMSTGMLAYDIIMGGGIRPAWITNFGPEQSAKTTGALTWLAASIVEGVPIIRFEDYEGSTGNSVPYVRNIFRAAGIKKKIYEIFGKKDPKTGKFINRPLVRYKSETRGEAFFDRLADILRKLPDKKKINEKWWLVFEDNKKNAHLKEHADASMPKKFGKGIYVPAKDGKLQGIVLTDSYPAMNPSSNDEEDADNSLALQARMFAKHLPRVKGRLAQKMVAVVGINQLRDAPMVRYGPPEREPGGQALKFNADQRIKHQPRAISGVPTSPKPKPSPDDSSVQVEPSVKYEDGQDTYRYVSIKAVKNKLGVPQRQAWMRIWVEDGAGNAQGLDPVYDTWFYLVNTGQAHGSKSNALNFELEGIGKGKKTISWVQFKRWILGDKEDKIEISKRLGFKPMDIRKFCFKQMETGTGEALYVAYRKAKRKAKKEEASSDD